MWIIIGKDYKCRLQPTSYHETSQHWKGFQETVGSRNNRIGCIVLPLASHQVMMPERCIPGVLPYAPDIMESVCTECQWHTVYGNAIYPSTLDVRKAMFLTWQKVQGGVAWWPTLGTLSCYLIILLSHCESTWGRVPVYPILKGVSHVSYWLNIERPASQG